MTHSIFLLKILHEFVSLFFEEPCVCCIWNIIFIHMNRLDVIHLQIITSKDTDKKVIQLLFLEMHIMQTYQMQTVPTFKFENKYKCTKTNLSLGIKILNISNDQSSVKCLQWEYWNNDSHSIKSFVMLATTFIVWYQNRLNRSTFTINLNSCRRFRWKGIENWNVQKCMDFCLYCTVAAIKWLQKHILSSSNLHNKAISSVEVESTTAR